MYRACEAELYRFDQLYRHFCEACGVARSVGKDGLKDLRTEVEAVYANWYVPALAAAWAGSWRAGCSPGGRSRG